ncbi:MAG: hypothetical protein IKM46_01335 [Clostridia bacterium]|nr:hypothetical protein [Clostridia bacterium]
MKIKFLAIMLVTVSLLTLASCGKSDEPPQITAPTGSNTTVDPAKDPVSGHHWVDGEEKYGDVKYPAAPEKYDAIYERGYNFSVFYTEANAKPFFVQLFRDSGELVETFETANPPVIREGVATEFCGLAVSTAEGDDDPYVVTFYDITNDRKSEPRENFVSAEYGYGVFVNENGFIIRDMFDDSVFYKEIAIDTAGFDKADRTLMSAQFSPNGKNIVVYYTVDGKNYDKPFKLK